MRWTVHWKFSGATVEGTVSVEAHNEQKARDYFLLHNPGCEILSITPSKETGS